MENSARACLDELLEQKCDAIVVAQGLMASDTVIYLHEKGLRLGEDIDLVTFVDYDSNINHLYSNQMDCIVQPVEELGEAAGEQILQRIESPDAPYLSRCSPPPTSPAGHKPVSPPPEQDAPGDFFVWPGILTTEAGYAMVGLVSGKKPLTGDPPQIPFCRQGYSEP